MALSSLSLTVLDSIISSATEADCDVIASHVKKRRIELEHQSRYVFIYIDSDYTWRKPYEPTIHFDKVCSPSELPSKVHDVLNIYIESYDANYKEFLYLIVNHEKFIHVKGSHADELRKLMSSGMLEERLEGNPENDDHNRTSNNVSCFYFKKHGLSLFTEIHESVGLENFFDNFEYSCGVLCLMKYCKTLDKLIRNGLPWC